MTSQLLINEPPLQVLPTLALKIGLNEAIILQQVHYWLNPNFNKKLIEDRYWVYNSCEGWREQFKFWSKDTIKRAIISLQKQGLLIIGNFNHDKFNHSKWYSIDYEQLQKLEACIDRFMQNAQIDDSKLHQSTDANCINRSMQLAPIDDGRLRKSLTETTSKDYTETNTHTTGTRETPSVDHRQEQPGVQNRMQPSFQRSSQSPSQHPFQPFGQYPAMMLALWNDAVRKADQPLPLTPERKRSLAHCLADSFEDDLDRWKDYCKQISQSPFLMGKGERGWKITLNWALDPKHIRKILDGDFQTHRPSTLQDDPTLEVKIGPRINLSQAHPLWAQVCEHLIESKGLAVFNSWIIDLIPEGFDSTHPVLRAPTRFVRDTVNQRYRSLIEDTLKAFNPTIEMVSIEMASIEMVSGLTEWPKQGEP